MSVVVLGNFDIQNANIIPNFYSTGMWYEYLRGDSLNVTNINGVINLAPGEYRVYTSKKLQTPIGTEEIAAEDSDFMVWPNPSTGQFTVYYDQQGKSNLKIDLLTITGHQVATLLNESHAGLYLGEFQYTTPGIYLLRIQDSERVQTRKIVVH